MIALAATHAPSRLRSARFVRTSDDDAVALDEQGNPVAVLYRQTADQWALESDRLVLSGLRVEFA